MRIILILLYKTLRKLYHTIKYTLQKLFCIIYFYVNNVKKFKFKTKGFPYVLVASNGKCKIGDDFLMINGLFGNPIGRPQRCVFYVGKNAELKIGKNVGISSTAIVAHYKILIGNNVKIGGGVCIYDTDFHSLNPVDRLNQTIDLKVKINKEVIIEDNVFIGAHSTILKGVQIGKNSIIGACSVVTKSVPSNEIWAGNPAKFIKKLAFDEENC
jgi:acetyltransferase-like isoleucine patch superfamily enzyme